ncbi:uncharacterized protein LOC144544992 [Carex rostrata]
MSWILGSVEPQIGINLRPYQTSVEMWNYVKTIYHHDNEAQKYQIDLEIHEYTQGQKNNQDYYSDFMVLWLEYNSIMYSKVPSAALVTIQELQQKNMQGRFLMKLRPEYEPIRRQLMARNPIPTLTECFREIMWEEQTMFTRSSIEEAAPESDSMELMTQGNPRVGKEIQCYSCQEYGHIAKDWWVGWPCPHEASIAPFSSHVALEVLVFR